MLLHIPINLIVYFLYQFLNSATCFCFNCRIFVTYQQNRSRFLFVHSQPLIDMKTAEWANKKGLPLLKDFSPRVLVSQYHTHCLASDQNRSKPKHAKHSLKQQPADNQEKKPISLKQPPASSSKPWTIFMGILPEKPPKMPDLRDNVGLRRDSISKQLQYTTKWDSTPHPAPDLPLDVLERVLFPRAFPSRIASPWHFEPQSITEVQHRANPQGRSTSPWTEVAMHLAEVLEPGHYWPSHSVLEQLKTGSQ